MICQTSVSENGTGVTLSASCAPRLGTPPLTALPQTGSLSMTGLAGKGNRATGYLIDVIPAALLGLFGLIPVIGNMIAAVFLTPYWLFRDVTGASIGKLLLGTRVVRKDGQPATASARIIRNVPLAIGPFLLIIPLLGYVVGPVVAGIISLVETVLILSQAERLGDKLAGTKVIKK